MADTYADVLLPLPLNEKFTYILPERLKSEVIPGKRVTVSFGNKKFYAALVISVHSEKPAGFNLKEILTSIDDAPVVLSDQIKLWQWISDYYCCAAGDVMKAALPSGLKMESQTKFRVINFDSGEKLNPEEKDLIEKLRGKNCTLNEIQKISGKSFSFLILKKIIDKGLLEVGEELEPGYKPKKQEFVAFHPDIKSMDDINLIMPRLARAKKQQGLLKHFMNCTDFSHEDDASAITKSRLLSGTGYNYADLKGLTRRNILVTFAKNISRLEIADESATQKYLSILSHEQQDVFEKIKKLFLTIPVVLLKGVTASGKTEIYIHLIEELIQKGKQVLYLVPEIALTTQIIRRLKNAFGRMVGIYHSKLSDQERIEIWNKILVFKEKPSESYHVVLGARSAVFLPFSDLGLIIVDEEHENSYKQFDPAPRYNARDVSIVLAAFNNAKVLLGSATPSCESYLNTLTGKYGLVEITKRYSEIRLPVVQIADLQNAYKKRQMKSMFTPELFDRISEALNNSEQVILFQNRRGYSSFIECMDCGWIPKCKSCDVTLTYHRQTGKLICHYCGFSRPCPELCPQCHSEEVKSRGFGTEKIESEIRKLFVDARIARMDIDTTSSKTAFEKIIRSLESKETDILVGTQMITKGLDFENVSLVGILNADNMVNFPDFRAHERAFQLLAQVSGRAGRRKKEGLVVIQTTQPNHPVIEAVKNQAFGSFMNSQLAERKLFRYPPYTRLIKIIIRHKSPEKVTQIARQLADLLRNDTGITVLGPESPLVSRIKLWHIKEIWLKIQKTSKVADQKKFIRDSVEMVKYMSDNSGSMIIIDVDPM